MKLYEYLKNKKITQAAFAKQLGVHITHFSKIVLQKQNPSVSLAQKIVDITNGEVSYEDLIIQCERKVCPTCGRKLPK